MLTPMEIKKHLLKQQIFHLLPVADHLFLVNGKETQYIDCSKVELPYGKQLVDDVVNRTETAMTQAHCFLATELALKAQKNAQKISLKQA